MKREGEQNGAEGPLHGHPRRGAEIKEGKKEGQRGKHRKK